MMVPQFKSLKHFITARRAFILFNRRMRSSPEVSDKYISVYEWTLKNGIHSNYSELV